MGLSCQPLLREFQIVHFSYQNALFYGHQFVLRQDSWVCPSKLLYRAGSIPKGYLFLDLPLTT
jgi:hypothetical protein